MFDELTVAYLSFRRSSIEKTFELNDYYLAGLNGIYYSFRKSSLS